MRKVILNTVNLDDGKIVIKGSGGGGGGGVAINNQSKSVEFTENGTSEVRYDAGYTGLEKVSVKVAIPVESKSVTIVENGTSEVAADEGYLDKVSINVAIPNEEKVVDITENGTTEVVAENGFLNKVIVNTNVASSGGEESAFPIFKYLTFEALEDEFSVSFTRNELMYCINGNGKWKILSVGGKTEAINKGDYISFKATPSDLSSGVGTFSTTGQFNAMGNALSLLYGDNAEENIGTKLPSYAFSSLFSASNVVNVSPTLFPSTSISSYSYNRVFYSCRKLTKAPTFCNTNVPTSCFNEAFGWCTSLIDVYPFDLKGGTSLGDNAFYKMFTNCTSLKNAGFAIPDSKQANVCMSYMFENCTNLEIAPIIGDIQGFYNYMFSIFSGCSKLKYIKCMSTYTKPYIDFGTLPEKGVLVKSASNTWIADKVPSGWTIVDEE